MGVPHLDRASGAFAVLKLARMGLMDSTYHRPPTTTERLGRLVAVLAGALAAMAFCAGTAVASTLLIEGAGDGHGVGMSQDGAYGYAIHGATYQEILAHYYTGTTIGQAPPKSVVRVLEGTKVVKVPLERYVRGVVSAEMSASWPLPALEAQAIASRTYALTAHAGGSRFDVYSDTRSQVYEGVAAETATTNAAVSATKGEIVLYGGAPAATYFFASSGGMTENIQDSFLGSQPEPWLKAVADPYETNASHWKLSMSFTTVAAHLSGLLKGSFRGIEVLTRGVSPRIVSARILGTHGDTNVTGPQLAGALALQSTWAYFSLENGATVKHEPDHSGQAQPPTASVPSSTPTPAPPAPGPQGGSQAPAAVTSSSAGGVLAG
jgi:SpoIID/LytB domain protein